MKSFRSKPVGWMNESYRHALAARGIKSYSAVKFKFVEGPPAEQIGPTVRVQTGKAAGDALVRVQVGEKVDPTILRSKVVRSESDLNRVDVKKALDEMPARDRGGVYDHGGLRRLIGKVKEKVQFEDLRLVDKREIEDEFLPPEFMEDREISSKAAAILEEKGQLLRDKDEELLPKSKERLAVLRAADDPLGTDDVQARRQLSLVMSQLDAPEGPRIERRPYAMVLGKPVSRIDTSDVTFHGSRAKMRLQKVLETLGKDVARKPGFTMLAGSKKPEDVSSKEWKAQLKAQKDFFDRQKALKELQDV